MCIASVARRSYSLVFAYHSTFSISQLPVCSNTARDQESAQKLLKAETTIAELQKTVRTLRSEQVLCGVRARGMWFDSRGGWAVVRGLVLPLCY